MTPTAWGIKLCSQALDPLARFISPGIYKKPYAAVTRVKLFQPFLGSKECWSTVHFPYVK